MKPRVSIIVPIYNMEKYLTRCLDSLLSQSLSEIEIIAVNDGSTDSSLEILNKYALTDHRLKVINKPNGGVSSARNEGLKLVNSDFIGFVDPDDWVEKDMYQTLYNAAIDYQTDVVMCSYIREFGSHSKLKEFNINEKVSYFNKDKKQKIVRRLVGPLGEEIGNPELLDSWGTIWTKLYRTDLIINNKLFFADLNEIGTNEDTLFNIKAVQFAQSFVFINTPFYHYWRDNKTSVTSGYKPNLLSQWTILYRNIENFISENGLSDDFYVALNNRKCMNLLGLGLNTISKENKSSAFKKVKMIGRLLKEPSIKQSFSQLEMSYFPAIWRAFYSFAKLRFSLGFYFMLISIEWLRKTVR